MGRGNMLMVRRSMVENPDVEVDNEGSLAERSLPLPSHVSSCEDLRRDCRHASGATLRRSWFHYLS